MQESKAIAYAELFFIIVGVLIQALGYLKVPPESLFPSFRVAFAICGIAVTCGIEISIYRRLLKPHFVAHTVTDSGSPALTRTDNQTESHSGPAPAPKSLVKEKPMIRRNDYVFYRFKFRQKQRIVGTVKSSELFNVYLFTESSFRTFDHGGNARELDGTEEVTYFEPNFEIPSDGYFFVVIENSSNKNISVDVELLLIA